MKWILLLAALALPKLASASEYGQLKCAGDRNGVQYEITWDVSRDTTPELVRINANGSREILIGEKSVGKTTVDWASQCHTSYNGGADWVSFYFNCDVGDRDVGGWIDARSDVYGLPNGSLQLNEDDFTLQSCL